VILCVAIGGLPAARNDVEIPERYGIYQSVGDTVGPGGLARGLRHIPFAVQVAREMEQLCPAAWMLNLTNPMTTICRGITRATSIRTIGLCHEVTGVSHHLAGLFGVPPETITLEVAGINHLPVILRCDASGYDGLDMLRAWLAEHGPFAHVGQLDLGSVFDVFIDRLAVKLTLFEQLGVLFGAGDRHVAEFMPGFLTNTSERGRRYGVVLTTVDQREEMACLRRAQIERFVDGQPEELQRSTEQLASVMAALAGGPAGRFIVNVPNQGQIDNLPREAVVECIAEVTSLGARPLAVGSLPHAAYAVIAPHVARQELIVEAALTNRREPALAALATDPLVPDPAAVKPLLNELLEANAAFEAT
jgi:alpha-galactosidase